MAVEFRHFTVTTPAGTLDTAPLITAVTMPARIVRQVRVRVPPGPNGLVGFQVAMGGVSLIPEDSGGFIVVNDDRLSFDLDGFPDSGTWQTITYNLGQFDHTLQFTFACDLPMIAPAAPVPPPSLAELSSAPTAEDLAAQAADAQLAALLAQASGAGAAVSRYTVTQILRLVLSYHPRASDAQLLNCVAIEWAEAGGNTDAISPSNDYGLWQINRIHFGDGIINSSNWRTPSVQVAEMWRLSAGMTNWAAWCTAWRDPGPNCGHGNLPNIQNGSAAWSQIDQVSAAIGRLTGTPPPGQAPPPVPPVLQAERALSAQWAEIRRYLSQTAPAQRASLRAVAARMGRIAP